MKPNLVTVCGHNTTMLRHMLNHYKDFVDEIYVVVYLSSDKDRVLSEVKEITRDGGLWQMMMNFKFIQNQYMS